MRLNARIDALEQRDGRLPVWVIASNEADAQRKLAAMVSSRSDVTVIVTGVSRCD